MKMCRACMSLSATLTPQRESKCIGACARATPIDTAVAAMTSEIASATVANSAMPQRRQAKVAWAMGDAKPTFKVNSVMANSVMAMASLAIRVEYPNQNLH
jgi:hypothetical protein